MSSITSSVEQLLSSNVRGIKYLIIRLLYHSKCCMYREYLSSVVSEPSTYREDSRVCNDCHDCSDSRTYV